MKKITLILLFILICLHGTGQIAAINWSKIAEGKISDYRKNNVRTISLKRNDSLVKTICFNGSNGLTVLNAGGDTLYSLFYDSRDRLSGIIKDNRVLDINYFEPDSIVQSLSLQTNSTPNDTVQKTVKLYRDYPAITQNEFYAISKLSHDTIAKEYHSAVIKREDSGWSYIIYRDFDTEIKRYNNGTSVTTIRQKGHYQYDSVVKLNGGRSDTYSYLVYPDSVWVTISRDSVHHKKTIGGRLVYENAGVDNALSYEILYTAGAKQAQRIVYGYRPDNKGNKVLWTKTFYTAKGKKIKTQHPGRKKYIRGKGVLTLKKKYQTLLVSCGSGSMSITYVSNKIWLISPSVLFPERMAAHFNPDYFFNRLEDSNLIYMTENRVTYSRCIIRSFKDSLWLRYKLEIPSVGKQFTFYPPYSGRERLPYPGWAGYTYTLQMVTQEGKTVKSPVLTANYDDPAAFDMIIFRYQSDHRHSNEVLQ